MRSSLLVLLLLVSPAAAEVEIVFVQPDGPGSTEKAKQAMAEFAAALGLPGTRAIYFNRTAAALEHIEQQRPAFGIVSLDFFLAQRKKLGLEPLAIARPGGRTTTRWSLVVPSGSALTLESLAGKRLAGAGLGDASFTSAVLLEGRLDAARQLTLVKVRSPLRAIRAVLRGQADALLLDQDAVGSLEQLPLYAKQLKVAHTFGPLPAAPVVRIAGRGDPKALVEALLGLDRRPQGKTVLSTFKLAGFARLPEQAFDKVARDHLRWKPRK